MFLFSSYEIHIVEYIRKGEFSRGRSVDCLAIDQV